MNFDAWIHEIKERRYAVHGIEIYKEGRLLYQYGITEDKRFPVYSATKTITSLAAGMAIEEGRLDLEKSVLYYLPEWAVREISPEQRAAYQRVTIQKLLTMSVDGFPFRPEGASWLKNALKYPVSSVNGFHYSNVSAYLVGAAVSCALEEDLYAYLQRKLFQPLHIIDPPCQRCPDGYFYGATGMYLTVHELSKIGRVLYGLGTYEGIRIVSESYCKAAVGMQQSNREGGYGYFIWKYGDGFSINGKWGQRCYILPKQKLMITFMADMPEHAERLTESMERYMLLD